MPSPRAPGWLRQAMEAEETAGTGRAVSQLRHLALRILEKDVLPWVQELLADPSAKDTDKLRAADWVAKLGAGYITPDLAGGEDVPELPPPVITLTEGELPGGTGVMDESLGAEHDGGDDDTGGPQLTDSGKSAGPVPHMGAA